jgi:hypothetical protein
MLSRALSAAAKTKMLVVLPIALVCFLCFSKNGISKTPAGKREPVVIYGNLDTTISSPAKNMRATTWSAVLANTKLSCSEAGCTVTGFTISFLPKGMDFRGPFTISGSNDVNANASAKAAMTEFSANTPCRMFIEDIHVQRDGADVKLSRPLVFSITGK